MKIAVTSKGRTLQDRVDPRFGRAAYILLIETDTMNFECVDNSANINAFKGAGIQSAAMIGNKGAEVLLTGYCGPNAFRTARAAGVKVVSDVGGTVEEAVQKFLRGSLAYSTAPNADGHW
jgi:predicted Fe-Mo cluster-binding NifX family protein